MKASRPLLGATLHESIQEFKDSPERTPMGCGAGPLVDFRLLETTISCHGQGVAVRPVVHMLLHFLVPAGVAAGAYRDRWRSAWLWMMTAMAIDLDHLLATPIFDPNRCSVGFHPLHRWPAIVVYVLLVLPKRTRLVGLGLVIHILLDISDCVWMRLAQ